MVKDSALRWLRVGMRSLIARSASLVLAVVAARLYTERQTVYAILYSLREFIDSFASKV